jgi:hypothetical protein
MTLMKRNKWIARDETLAETLDFKRELVAWRRECGPQTFGEFLIEG